MLHLPEMAQTNFNYVWNIVIYCFAIRKTLICRFAIRKTLIFRFAIRKTLTFWFAIRKPVICQFSMCKTAKSLSTIKIIQSDF